MFQSQFIVESWGIFFFFLTMNGCLYSVHKKSNADEFQDVFIAKHEIENMLEIC